MCMARIPCSFSAQEEFLDMIDARAARLGMKRSEYIVHALRRDLQEGGSFNIVQESGPISGHHNSATIQSTSASGAPLPEAVPSRKAEKYPKPKRSKKK